MKLGDKIDRMYAIKQERAELEAQRGVLKEEYDELEQSILTDLDDLGTDTAKTATANVAKSEVVVPVVKSWDDLWAYVKETDSFYLLYKQMTQAPYRELLAAGESVPGVEPFTQVKLSLTKRK
jgi:hypothetical protein